MKTSKKIISMLLCVVMVLSTFAGLGLVLDDFIAKAADITIGGITQTRVVGTDGSYESIYAGYRDRFFTGHSSNQPTNFVIPGLSSKDDYTPQGMTYWEAKEWILISAYHAGGTNPSVIYALDVKTTNMVAVFKLYNQDGSANMSHGGGIAASEHNFYYADSGSKISYFPLSEMDVAEGTSKNITLKGSIDCGGELNGVATSYCCYEDGVLWTGNFYWSGDDRYKATWHSSYPSVLIGYNLKGNSSAEEWANLQNTNLIKPTEATNASGSAMTYTVRADDKGFIDISGKSSGNTSETFAGFGNIYLKHGTKYILEYDQGADYAHTDMYFLRDGGTGSFSNIKNTLNNGVATKTDNGDGTYHFKLEFTPGTKLPNTEGNWGSTDESGNVVDASGNYLIRFDQDASGDASFEIKNIRIREAATAANDGKDRAGNPTYVVPFNSDLDRLQYAMVYKGKIYLSRSWSRNNTGNHIRELCVGNFDINIPGGTDITVNGRLRGCSVVLYENVTKFGAGAGLAKANEMLFMSEALCIINDYLYIFSEGAAWAYYGKDGTADNNLCDEPIDVIWKVDQNAIMGETRGIGGMEPVLHYEKVRSLSDINATDDYLIVHQSREIDPVTQKPYLYAIDSYGGYGERKLPKSNESSQKLLGDSMGVVGYAISDYSIQGDEIYINEDDSYKESIHWKFEGINQTGDTKFRIKNGDSYFANEPYLYFGSRTFAMSNNQRTGLDNIHIEQYNPETTYGNFRLYFNSAATNPKYYLWCNDGADQELLDAYTYYYANHPHSDYDPNYEDMTEIPGTFHADAEFAKGDLTDSGNITGAPFDSVDNQILHIYKRVRDPYGSVADSRIYSDMNATLQADGTYKIDLETYAISPYVYTQLSKTRPTDFVFVVDMADSDMSAFDVAGYQYWGASNTLSLKAVAGTEDAADGAGTWTGGNIYYRLNDANGTLVKLNAETSSKSNVSWSIDKKQDVWLYYTNPSDNQIYYWNGSAFTTTKTVAATIRASSVSGRADKTIYTGVHYSYEPTKCSRINAARGLIEDLSYKIAQDNPNHRIALVNFGSDSAENWTNTGTYYNTSSNFVQYTGETSITDANYANCLYTSSQFSTLRASVNSMVQTDGKVKNAGSDPDTYSDHGMYMANKILQNSGSSYFADGDRSACVILLTTSVPGNSASDTTEVRRVSDGAIAQSQKIKLERGAYVYAVQYGDCSEKYAQMNSYLEYCSSMYITAADMDTPGDLNISNIDYKMDAPTGSAYNHDSLLNNILNNVNLNSKNALAKITSESVLREKLSSAFIVPDNTTVTVETANAHYDGIGRLYFDTPVSASEVTTTIDKTNKTITATGFSYMDNYIAETNKDNAKKLIITIEGVLADENAKLDNTSINDTSSTAIYEDSTFTTASKRFPTAHFHIPEYTYALDYGMSLKDIHINGTPVSVDDSLAKQSTYSTSLATDMMGIDIGSDSSLIYSLKDNADGTEAKSKGYVLCKRSDGTYDWFRINVVPASNVMYDNDHVTVTDASGKVAWTSNGTMAHKYLDVDEKDIYGYSSTFADDYNEYSNGTHLSTTVDKTNNKSNKATFEFTGTGFDLIGTCGPDTGIQAIKVTNKTTGASKGYIVDTYYSDANYGTLTQIPVFTYSGERGDYSVEVTAVYLSSAGALKTAAAEETAVEGTDLVAQSAPVDFTSADSIYAELGMDDFIGIETEIIWFDENSVLNGGSGAEGGLGTQAGATELNNVIDGYRIYNPLDEGQAATYYSVNEKAAEYYDVISQLDNSQNLFAYVEGGSGSFSFADYDKNSNKPKHEVYLEKGENGVTFSFMKDPVITTYRVMLSMRSASGVPVTVSINGNTFDVNSSTDMYYDITNYASRDASTGKFTITVKNTSGGLLAIGKVKVSNASIVTTSSADIAQVASLMTAAYTPVDANGVAATAPVTNYPDYQPDPKPLNPDFSLDIDEIIPLPDATPDEPVVEEPSELEQFFAKLASFFEKILAAISKAFNFIVDTFKNI